MGRRIFTKFMADLANGFNYIIGCGDSINVFRDNWLFKILILIFLNQLWISSYRWYMEYTFD